jgi:lipopolysaccharide/colanic/teichoic acid biosynthesis glycosyltransferase
MVPKIIMQSFSANLPFRALIAAISLTLLYFVVYWFKTNSFEYNRSYSLLYIIYLFVWLSSAVYFRVYKVFAEVSARNAIKVITIHSFTAFLILNLIVRISDLGLISRSFLVIIILIPMIAQFFALAVYSVVHKSWLPSESIIPNYNIYRFLGVFGFKKAFLSATLLMITMVIAVILKNGRLDTYTQWQELAGLLLTAWVFSALLTDKFKPRIGANFYYKIAPIIKSNIFNILFLATIHYLLRQDSIARSLVFGTALAAGFLELVINAIWFKWRLRVIEEHQVQAGISEVKQYPLTVSYPDKSNEDDVAEEIIRYIQRLSGSNAKTMAHLTKDVFAIHDPVNANFEVIYTKQVQNVQVLDSSHFGTIVNFEKINNIRYINQYFIYCHKALTTGGTLIGTYEALENIHSNFRSRMPRFIYLIIYPFYFMFHRMFPKLPGIRHLYFVITKGLDRNISRAEILGRLSYCGFKYIKDYEVNGMRYFAAEKKNSISSEPYPSYGPVIALERICINGQIKRIYKLRTMHPFSEFIQKEIFEQNKLDERGKIHDDFRRTKWGTLLRKYWIDELPQIVNWVRGDLDLVGIRALSEHFYSLYPDDLKKLRIKVNPGLVPPYYADMPNNWEEILESERRYLFQKIEKPLRTDVKYFIKAFYNIVFRKARSL